MAKKFQLRLLPACGSDLPRSVASSRLMKVGVLALILAGMAAEPVIVDDKDVVWATDSTTSSREKAGTQRHSTKAIGSARISGQAFAKRSDGILAYPAGDPVWLLPVSQPVLEVVGRSAMRRLEDLRDAIPRANEGEEKLRLLTNAFGEGRDFSADYESLAVKQTLCDSEGRFVINGIPAGEYYVVTHIEWRDEDGRHYAEPSEYVKLSNGERTRILLVER